MRLAGWFVPWLLGVGGGVAHRPSGCDGCVPLQGTWPQLLPCNPTCCPSCHNAGDSITQIIKRTGLKDSFNVQFSPAAGWAAYPLGVSGNDVEDLAWRLFTGSERPTRAPKAVALLVGVNNLQASLAVGGFGC